MQHRVMPYDDVRIVQSDATSVDDGDVDSRAPAFGDVALTPMFGAATPFADVDPRARASRTSRWRTARQTMYVATLFVGGVSIARSAPVRTQRPAELLALQPVIVSAPTREQMRVALRADSVARILRRHDVDSLNAHLWADAFVRYGEALHVNPRLLVAIAYAESQFNPQAHSPAGAIGLMQVVPERRAWREYEPQCGVMTARTLREPRTNICYGAHIFHEFLTVHHGDTDHALAAYNNGTGELNGYPDRVYSSMYALRH